MPHSSINLIRDIPDFPTPGIVFKDITPVLADAAAFQSVIADMAAPYIGQGLTHVAGIEARGFILATPVADRLSLGFVPVRKPGKLPAATRSGPTSSNTEPTCLNSMPMRSVPAIGCWWLTMSSPPEAPLPRLSN